MEHQADPAPPGEGSGLPRRAAFLVGMKRSGTSLLKALLDGHPQVFVLPRESKTFLWHGADDPVVALLETTRYGECFAPGTPARRRFVSALRRRLEGPVGVPAAVFALAAAVAAARRPGAAARLWVEKTPDHLLEVPSLLAAFGHATRVVCTVRDPRSQIASRLRNLRNHGYEGRFSIRQLARKWAMADEVIRHLAATREEVEVVRYEDLVRTPAKAMGAVAQHLGIPWDQRLLEPTREGQGWEGNTSFRQRPRGISQRSLGRYRAELTRAQVRQVETLLRPRMQFWGYRPEHGRRSPAAATRWLLELRARGTARRLLRRASRADRPATRGPS